MKKPIKSCTVTLTIGWEEWCSLPDLSLPALKFKTDTGAKTSSLHAMNIETFFEGEIEFVRFATTPIQGKKSPHVQCVMPIARRKVVTSSNGFKEKRIVIKTTFCLGERSWKIEITLANRSSMGYRMLLGRDAMRYVLIKPRSSFCLGTPTESPESLYK